MSIASDSTPVRLSPAVRKKLRQQEANQAIIQRSIQLIQLQTGDSWTIHIDAKKGRAGIARVDIPLGTTIVHEHAAGWVLSSDAASNGHYCRHCCKNYDTPPKFPPCCIYTSYCSDQCLTLDSRLHFYTCPVLPLIPHWAAQSQADPDLLRLVAHTLAGWFIEQEENMNKSQQASSSSSSSSSPPSSSPSPSRSPSAPKARWSNVQDLISNIESADKSWMASVTSAMTSLRQEYEKQEKFKGMDIPTVQTLVELCSRINSNSHAIFDISSSSNSVIGLGLFPTTSILNHSCAPNSFFSCGASGEMFVRTVRDVKKGEELTVPYVDLYQARWERMKELWSDKVFICTCDRCRYEEKAPKSFASESTITAAQLADWNQVGGIYCTECTAKAAEESLNEMSFDDAKKGKKKKKAKAATESSSDNSTASASSSSSSSTSSSFYPFLPSLPPPPANIGLLTWRGTGMDEIRPVSTPAQESSVMSRVSWACDRKGCTAKWSHQQVNERLQPIVDLYRQAAELKQSRKLEQALVGYEKMIHELSAYVPPLHALYISALSPALNISLYLARQTSSLARWSASEQFAAGILTRMQRVFPRNWLETSNFYIVLAEAIDEQAKLTTNETTKKELENRRNLAYQEAHRIRSIVCGPQHPRTLSTPTPFREEKK